MSKKEVKIKWTERTKSDDYHSKFGTGPSSHPRFSEAEIIFQDENIKTFQLKVKDEETARDMEHHIKSFYGYFDIHIIVTGITPNVGDIRRLGRVR